MVNVFSFYISWNPFISDDSIKEMASGLVFVFVLFLFWAWVWVVVWVGFGFFNLMLWLCAYSGRNRSWRKKAMALKKINPESF